MKAEYAIQYGKQPDLWPIIIGMKDPDTDIFSVPVENAVGTNSIHNAITLIKFNNDQVIYDEVRRNFIDGVGSGNKYYAGIFSDQWIGYAQTRGFLLFNLATKSFADHIPLQSGDEYFTGVSAFDAKKFQFIFQVRNDCYLDSKRFLRLLEFDTQGNFKQLANFEAGLHKVGYLEPWAIRNKTIFIYNNDSISITAYDMNFNPVKHPFCDLFNSIENFRCLDQLTLHPSLPLAVLVEMDREARTDYKVYLVNWQHPDPEKRIIELLRQEISPFSEWAKIRSLYVSDFQFSPDGSWLVFRDESEEVIQRAPNPTFIAMPVDGDYSVPLGKPKV
ncbi:MAG: hypothetical protein GF401_10705, partial [Chitinivibrionales bacterium]|nr:hypothetical protein [Chitinivibrionales bacterium]